MDEALVTVKTFRFLPAAEGVRMHLESEGVTVFLADAETVNMDWFLGNAIGYIKLQVPQSQAERAVEMLSQQRAQMEDRAREGEGEESAGCLACGHAIAAEEIACPACGWSFVGEEDD
jgi:hypothetical protein